MSIDPNWRDWLPLEAVIRPAVRDRLQAAVGAWSARWFVGVQISLGALKAVKENPRTNTDGAGWRLYGGAIGLSLSGRAAKRLIGFSLQASQDGLPATPADQDVLDCFQESLVEDLILQVQAVLGLADTPAGPSIRVDDPYSGGGIEATLMDAEGGVYAALAIPQGAVLPLCRASLPPAPAPRSRLGTMLTALGPTPAVLEPRLGDAEIGLEELVHLAVGDVLILDSRLDRGAAIALAGSEQVIAHARVLKDKGRIALALQQ